MRRFTFLDQRMAFGAKHPGGKFELSRKILKICASQRGLLLQTTAT